MILDNNFFQKDVTEVAPQLVGKLLCRRFPDGSVKKIRITETEIYKGEEDSACHARHGKTARNAVMYEAGGLSYIYLIYGLHYLLNVVTGEKGAPQAVLIRAGEGFGGPARLTKELGIDKSQNFKSMTTGENIWFEDDGFTCEIEAAPRVGIEYATEPYKSIKWRFILKRQN